MRVGRRGIKASEIKSGQRLKAATGQRISLGHERLRDEGIWSFGSLAAQRWSQAGRGATIANEILVGTIVRSVRRVRIIAVRV
jgi:hypothetical protein